MSTTWQWAKANPDAAARKIREVERENAALRQALEDMPTCRCGLSTDEQCALSVENAALRTAAVEVCAIARVWVTVWGDKLSPDTVKRFAELEKQILKNTQP